MYQRLLACLTACLFGLFWPASAQEAPQRPYDGLLENPSLQRIVSLQNARNASALVGMLSDADPAVRARAAFALGSVQDSSAIPYLAQLLDDADAGVRADAAFAIGQTGRPDDDLLALRLSIEDDDAALHELLQAVGKTGLPEDLDHVLEANIPDELEWSRSLSITRFGLRGIITDVAVARQIALLEDASPHVRQYAGYYFWRIRAPEAWQSQAADLREALDRLENNEPTAGYLALALAGLEDQTDLPRLRALLASPEWRVRVRVVRALSFFSEDAGVRGDLLDALDDPVHHVAISAAASLSEVDDLSEAHIGRSLAAMNVDDPVRATISGHLLTALARSGEGAAVLEAAADVQDMSPSTRAPLLSALAYVADENARRLLESSMRSEHNAIAFAATSAMVARWRRMKAHGAPIEPYYDAFSDAVRTGDVALVYAAAPALADTLFVRRGSVDVLSNVLQSLEPPRDTEAMLAIIGALGAIDNRAARDALALAADHPHDAVREAARRHLGQPVASGAAAEIRPIDWDYLSSLGPRPNLTLETDVGTITVELYSDQAPQTVETIVRLAQEGRYDGVPFHRVVPDFVIQGGDFARGDGFGGPGFEIRSEFARILYDRGVAGMASAGKDTEGSQFFFTHSMQPHLDGSYTAFGRIVEGLDVLDAVAPGTLITRAYLID